MASGRTADANITKETNDKVFESFLCFAMIDLQLFGDTLF